VNFAQIIAQLLIAFPEFEALFTSYAARVGATDADVAAALVEARQLAAKFSDPGQYFGDAPTGHGSIVTPPAPTGPPYETAFQLPIPDDATLKAAPYNFVVGDHVAIGKLATNDQQFIVVLAANGVNGQEWRFLRNIT
jgi:hypothetical protein